MKCLICNLDLYEYETCKVGWKGLKRLVEVSILRKDDLAEALEGIETITLHRVCRVRYINPRVKTVNPPNCQHKEFEHEFEYVPAMIQNIPKVKVASESIKAGSNSVNVGNPVRTFITDTTLPHGNCMSMTNYENKSENVEWNGMIASNTLETAEDPPEPIEISITAYNPVLVEGHSSNINTDGSTDLKYMLCVKNIASKLPNTRISDDNVTFHGPDLEETLDCEPLNYEEDPTKVFPFHHLCLFCTKDISEKFIQNEKKKPVTCRNHVCFVATKHVKEKIMSIFTRLPTPENEMIVKRIQDVDLLEVRAGYHKSCYMKFLVETRGKRGRPEKKELISAMEKIYRCIDESDRTEFTSTELLSASIHDDYKPDWRTVERKLQMKYTGRIYFTTVAGHSTIVTVIKDTGSGVNMFAQPWNLNGTELGGQIPDYVIEKKKRNKTKKDKTKREADREINEENHVEEDITEDYDEEFIEDPFNSEEKRTRKKIMKDRMKRNPDRQINEENVEKIRQDYDDDFIEDTFNSEDNIIEIERNLLICRICLSTDRKLDVLGEYFHTFQNLCSDIIVQDFESKLFLLCWECKALLKKVKHFQEKIVTAQTLLTTEARPKCISTLSKTTPAIDCCTTADEQTAQQEYVKPNAVAVDVNNTVKESNMNCDAFDDDNIDINTDDDTGYQERTTTKRIGHDDTEVQERLRRTSKRTTTKVTGYDETEDQERPKRTSKRRITKEILKDSSDSDQNSEEPEQYEPPKKKNRGKRTKNNLSKGKKLKMPYTLIVQTYVTETKMKREPIEPHELQYWLDTERNSAYFKRLKNNKCMKCISEVPENHNELCHSEAYSYVCTICESTFPSEGKLESHVAGHYYILRCELCPYKCYNETHMRGHVESHRRLVQCLECFAAFETFGILKDHFNKLHTYAECDYCGKRLTHKSVVEKHIERFHKPKACTICKTTYKSHSRLLLHMNLRHRVERTEAAYCVQCDIQFDNEALLKRHVYSNIRHKHEWKRDPKKYVKEQIKCPECPKVYSCKISLIYHYNYVHAKKYNFYCKLCDKSFLSKFRYRMHVRNTHEGYKPPKNKFCDICGRGFSDNRILIHHIRTHTGERPHACPHCASSFAQKAALRSHIAHVHEKQQRSTAGKACTKTRPSAAEPTSFLDYDF